MTPTKQTRATEEAIEYVLRDYRAVFPDEFTPPAYSKARAALSALLAERDQLRSCLYSLQFTLQTPSAWSDDLSERQWLVNIRAEAQQIIRDALSITEKP